MHLILYHPVNSDNVDLKPLLSERIFMENIRRVACWLNLPDVTFGIITVYSLPASKFVGMLGIVGLSAGKSMHVGGIKTEGQYS